MGWIKNTIFLGTGVLTLYGVYSLGHMNGYSTGHKDGETQAYARAQKVFGKIMVKTSKGIEDIINKNFEEGKRMLTIDLKEVGLEEK